MGRHLCIVGIAFCIARLYTFIHGCILEMMSGYTTTGATILNDIEALPHGLLMWRSERPTS